MLSQKYCSHISIQRTTREYLRWRAERIPSCMPGWRSWRKSWRYVLLIAGPCGPLWPFTCSPPIANSSQDGDITQKGCAKLIGSDKDSSSLTAEKAADCCRRDWEYIADHFTPQLPEAPNTFVQPVSCPCFGERYARPPNTYSRQHTASFE